MKEIKDKKTMVVTLGLPCSGKTTLINKEYANFRKVSADDLKLTHPKYDPDNVTNEVHQWSVKAAKNNLYHALKEFVDVVFDSGSINNKYTIEILDYVKKTHPEYIIQLVWVKTPYQVCLERNKLRERKVPEYAITDKAVKENSQYHNLLPYVTVAYIEPYFTNRAIFCDMDGVLAAQTTLPIINNEIDFVNGEIHKWQKPVLPVRDQLLKMKIENASELYILSATPNSFSSNEKIEWLAKHLPSMSKDRIYFVNQGKHKAEMLENLARKLKIPKSDVLMVDDTHAILYDVKARGMNAMHVSEFLTLNT